MRLSEYSDDEIIEEIKHRGLKIEVVCPCGCDESEMQVIKIGGVVFDLRT